MDIDFHGSAGRLPDFLVVGAARSGTSTLCSLLARHPQVFFPAEKEPMFFSVYGLDWHYLDSRTGKPLEFVIENLDGYLELFKPATQDQLLGEGSTWYLYFYSRTIENIRRTYGEQSAQLRILIILRNPVERAWSHYWQKKRNGEESLTFEKAIEPTVVRERQQKRLWPGFDYLGFGRYHSQVKAYREAFEQVKVLLLEDLARDVDSVMAGVYKFLGLKAIEFPVPRKRLNVAGSPRNQFYAWLGKFLYQPNSLKSSLKILLPRRTRRKWKDSLSEVLFRHEPMPESVRKELKEVYRGDINALSGLIGRDLSSWLI
ncbi:MAG: sulfotransferase family protein [Candidatus Aminicenantales bacterium]